MEKNESKKHIDTIRLAGVIKESIVDGPGIRFVIFAQGCPHRCNGCHNPETFDEKGGYISNIANLLSAIDDNPLLKGVTFSGGEPLLQAEAFCIIANHVKNQGMDIVLFSGYTYEQIIEMSKNDDAVEELINLVDILIDGRFEKDKVDLTLTFRGSSNQRIIDVKESRKRSVVQELILDL